MLLVSGGVAGSGSTDSTEIYDPDYESWRAGAALPSPLSSLSATTIDNRVLIIGINNYENF